MAARHEVMRFGLVGTAGFMIDGGVLAFLMAQGANHYYARLVSFPVAVLTTWWLNRHWTFSDSDRSRPGRQFNRYFTLQVIAALANFLVYLAILEFVTPDWRNALLALAVGASLGLAINFMGSRRLIFRKLPRTAGNDTKAP